MDKFWIVLRDKGETYVTKRHPSLEAAKDEAARLAGKEGNRFFIAEAFASVEPAEFPLRWGILKNPDSDDPIPF